MDWLMRPTCRSCAPIPRDRQLAGAADFSPAATGTAANAQPAFTDFVNATVVGRYVFYNNSHWDGDNPAANNADDSAIATDKRTAPGQTASFANYTSYSRGLNGIMIDVAGLPLNLTRDDFIFRVGTSDDPSSWKNAPGLQNIAVRYGAGVGGSDRVTVTWPDNWIENSWLQVTVKATPRTGLVQDDVFYFGNMAGETGNSNTDAHVNATDQLMARVDLAASVSITAISDFNRDGQVDGTDELIARNNPNGLNEDVVFPAPAATAGGLARYAAGFLQSGRRRILPRLWPRPGPNNPGHDLGYGRGPLGVKSTRQLLRWFSPQHRWRRRPGRRFRPSSAHLPIPARWYTIRRPSSTRRPARSSCCSPSTIVECWSRSRADDGLTWSTPTDITSSVKVTAAGNPNPAEFPSNPWDWYAVGPTDEFRLQ